MTLEEVSLFLRLRPEKVWKMVEDEFFPRPYTVTSDKFLKGTRNHTVPLYRWMLSEVEDWIDPIIRQQRGEDWRQRFTVRRLVPERAAPERESIFLSMAELAAWLGIYPSTIYRWLKSGDFPEPFQLCPKGDLEDATTTRYRKSDIDAWIASRPRGVQVREGQGNVHEKGADAAGAPRVWKNPPLD